MSPNTPARAVRGTGQALPSHQGILHVSYEIWRFLLLQ